MQDINRKLECILKWCAVAHLHALTVAANSATIQTVLEQPLNPWHDSPVLEYHHEIKEKQHNHCDCFAQCDSIIPCKCDEQQNVRAVQQRITCNWPPIQLLKIIIIMSRMENGKSHRLNTWTGLGAASDATAATPSVLNINEPIIVPRPISDSVMNVLHIILLTIMSSDLNESLCTKTPSYLT